MTKIKRLNNDHGQWNKLGRNVAIKVDEILKPLIQEAEKKGYSMPDLERIVTHAIGFQTSMATLQRLARESKKRPRK